MDGWMDGCLMRKEEEESRMMPLAHVRRSLLVGMRSSGRGTGANCGSAGGPR